MTTKKPKDRNAEVDFCGQNRSNATHAPLTDPEARLYKKSPGTGASLCFTGHTLIDAADSTTGPRNPPQGNGLIVQTEMTQADGHAADSATGPRNPPQGNGLIVQTGMTQADGHAERRAALAMIHRHSPG